MGSDVPGSAAARSPKPCSPKALAKSPASGNDDRCNRAHSPAVVRTGCARWRLSQGQIGSAAAIAAGDCSGRLLTGRRTTRSIALSRVSEGSSPEARHPMPGIAPVDRVSRFRADAGAAPLRRARALLRMAGHGRRARRDLVLHRPLLLWRRRTRARFRSARPRRPFRLEIVRDGGDRDAGLRADGLAARWQDTPDQCSVEGCGWDDVLRVRHRARLAVRRLPRHADGGGPRAASRSAATISSSCAREPGKKPGRILQVAATGTWTAYNTWGGSNHYEGITGPEPQPVRHHVSALERPWCRGFVVLPPEAPRVPLEISLPPATTPRYPHMEWAFATGHSKKYASSGWASYDSHFFRWAERAGYAVDLASQHELHFSPELLDGYDCVVFVGHDEYWTWEMRDAVDAYVERGGHARASPAISCGRRGWRTRADGRSATNTAPAPKTRSIAAATSAAPPIPGRRRRSAGPARRPSGSTPATASMSAGAAARRAACAAFPSTGRSTGRSPAPASIMATCSAPTAMSSATRSTGSTTTSATACPTPSADSGAPEGLQILAVGMASQVEEERR